MPRPPRILVPGGHYHVCARGVARSLIFMDTEDRTLFVLLLTTTARRLEWRLHAWCLMPNHYHLVVETPRPNLSAGMQRLNGAYGQLFNHRYGRKGHLFQGRFWSGLIESDEQLAHTCEYVLYNPVRAGLCESPRAWRWIGGRVAALALSGV